MEAYESFAALAMETEGLVVSEAVKFPVRRQTAKAAYYEFQTHGFEVDLVGARRDKLVLATVKSFFGCKASKLHEPAIRDWCSKQVFGGGPIQVFDARDVAIKVRSVATSKSYRDNPALVAMKVLAEAEMLLPLSGDD